MPEKDAKPQRPRAGSRPKRTRYRFFMNPYADMAFTKCPKCETKTRQRKLPLVIHIEPGYMFVVNKACRYCERCDLLIARQAQVEALMAEAFATRAPEIIGNEYLAIGTMDRADWKKGTEAMILPAAVIERMYIFEDVWKFEPGGWYLPDSDS